MAAGPEAGGRIAKQNQGEGFVERGLGGIRSFFRHLFNGGSDPRPRAYDNRPGRRTYDDRGRLRQNDYAGEDRQERYAYNRGREPDSRTLAPYSPFYDRGGYDDRRRDEDAYRRAMEPYRRDYGDDGYYGR